MISFDYTINFGQNSLNTDKYYNIYFEDKKIAQKVTFPYKISFNKWKNLYDVVIENDYCGSKKMIQIVGQTTTINYTTQGFPTTNPIFIVPTTTVRPPDTTLTTSTTTVLPKSLSIVSISVTKCINTNGIIVSNTLVKFGGNYSNKLLIQITNIVTNVIFRKFDGGNITTKDFTINLPIGKYKFEIKDIENELLYDVKNNVNINCPSPKFDIQYIPNNCGENNAKLRIYNIKNANKFRYCFGETFFCNVNFDTPDAIVDEPLTEITIELNSGKFIDYTNGDFITVRGFNFTEADFTDVKIELTPCKKSATDDIIYVTSSYKDIKIDENGINVRITVNLLQNGKKYNAPTDISISGQYTTFMNSTYILQQFDMIILTGTSSSSIYKATSNGTEIFEIYDTCISNIEPNVYLGKYFQNNSPCS